MRVWGVTIAALLLAGCVLDVGPFRGPEPLREKRVLGESGPKIAMIEVIGLIQQGERSSALGIVRPSLVSRTVEALKLAEKDDDVAAVLLRVNSPGGTVSASETLYHELVRWKEKTRRPVIAYFDGLAASGGYYVAMASDEIYAHPTAITGSIGVILSGINVAGLMERFGIEDQTFTSGPFKDTGSPLREMRPDERAHFESLVDDLFERFREVVDDGRPALSTERVSELADGRIFTARQAAELGLVDHIGHLDDAVFAIEQRLDVSESRLVVYQPPSEYRDNVYTKNGINVQMVDIDLWPLERGSLEPGFYYLWPPFLAR